MREREREKERKEAEITAIIEAKEREREGESCVACFPAENRSAAKGAEAEAEREMSKKDLASSFP